MEDESNAFIETGDVVIEPQHSDQEEIKFKAVGDKWSKVFRFLLLCFVGCVPLICIVYTVLWLVQLTQNGPDICEIEFLGKFCTIFGTFVDFSGYVLFGCVFFVPLLITVIVWKKSKKFRLTQIILSFTFGYMIMITIVLVLQLFGILTWLLIKGQYLGPSWTMCSIGATEILFMLSFLSPLISILFFVLRKKK